MTSSKTTKRALVASVCATLMCIAMLIGTTFAWFTDTASTSVNKIQSGTLDVVLQMKNPEYTGTDDSTHDEWISAEGKTLEFVKAADGSTQTVLWEPGCTYELPQLKVVNNGSLALKYKVKFSAVNTEADDLKLAKVLDVTMQIGDGAERSVGTLYDVLASTDEDGYAHGTLKANADSGAITLKVKMSETAGNEYQNLTIGGIAVTVVATQDTVEYDSTDNQYDADAEYPIYVVESVAIDSNNKVTTSVTVKTDKTVSVDGETAPLAQATVPTGVQMETGKTQVALSITNTAVVADGTTVGDDQASKSFEIKLEGVSSSNSQEITVEFYTEKNLSNVTIYHNGAVMDASKYSYDSTTGKVTIKSATFSPFDLVYDTGVKEAASEAGLVAAIQNAKAGDTIKLADDITIDSANYSSSNRLYVRTNNITIDLNKKTLTVPNYTFSLSGDNITLKNGKVVASEKASYTIVANGKNVTIDGVTIDGLTSVGGISVSGYAGNDVKKGVSATIKNCNIKAKNYYAVCAQGEASAIVESSTLDASESTEGNAFFWIEKAFTDDYGTVGNSNLTYDKATVKLVGDKPLYNVSGLAPVEK